MVTNQGEAPLAGVRVVDLSTGIAGGYATKLLADGGADVLKVEAPDGDPLRRWSASGADLTDDGSLFTFLATSKRGAVVDASDDDARARLDELLASADVVVWSPGSSTAEHDALQPAAIRAAHPHLVVTAITPFGLDSPWTGRPAAELTLQAWSGGVIRLSRGYPDLPPVQAGGRVGEWSTAVFATVGTLAALRQGGGDLVDVSVLEAMSSTLTYYPVTFHDLLDRPIQQDRFVPIPGISEASDGMVGLGTGTGQQWLDFCAMVGHPEWQTEFAMFTERGPIRPDIDAWVGERTVDEVLDIATAFRLPNAPIVHGGNAQDIEHFRERDIYRPNPRDGVANPRPAVRSDVVRLRDPEPAPRLGEHELSWSGERRPATANRRSQPLEGIRVLDMTAFWAGPFTSNHLAMLGAEVIHVESANRPDGARMIGGVPHTEDEWWEKGPIFAAANTDKKSIAVDLGQDRGREVLREVLASCDVLVENYTARVLDNMGLDHGTLRAEFPELIMVRMPGFGLEGPWREVAAFAYVIEDASGLTWLNGHPEVPPIEPYGFGDPNAGLHALYGLQLALAHRDRTGEGSLVEAAMIDAALNVAAEQVIEHDAYGALLTRTGNRGPTAAPQNLYQVRGPNEYGQDDDWVAIAVETDEQWQALRTALGDPEWAADEALATHEGRLAAHDVLDEHLAAWCRERSGDDVVDALWSQGVPVGKVMQPHRQDDLPPYAARGYFEELDHPVAGRARYSTMPMRFENGPERVHRRHAPLIGEHTDDVLRDAGLTDEQIVGLRADGVIGGTPPVAG